MAKEKTTPVEETAPEKEEDALSSYLEKSADNNDKTDEKPKKKRNLLPLWITLAGVLVVGIVITIVLLSKPKPVTAADLKNDAPMKYYVDDDGQHQAKPVLNENGKLDTDNFKLNGTLISRIPSEIKQIDVSNKSGSFTLLLNTPFTTDPATGETVRGETTYKLKGYEKISLQTGEPDVIANDCSSTLFKRIADVDGKKAKDFGFNKPIATIKTHFTDGKYSTIIVGGKAPNNDGTYIMFGSNKTIYLVDNTYIDGFLFSVLDLMPLDITDAPQSVTDSEFKSISISGSAFSETIELKPNTDEAINTTNVMTAPYTMFANEVEISNIAGGIRGLYAEEVVCMNPSDSQLSDLGVAKPYAKITAKYADKTITLRASEPKDGYVNLYSDSKKLVYKISADKVAWVQTSTEKLTPAIVLAPNYPKISNITVTDKNGTNAIDVKTTSDTVDNTDGYTETIYYTTATLNGKVLDEYNFRTFTQNICNMTNAGKLGDEKAGKTAITITISYSTGRNADTIKIYETSGTKYIAELNGRKLCLVNKNLSKNLSENVQALLKGETVDSI